MAKNPCFYKIPIRNRETRIPQGVTVSDPEEAQEVVGLYR